MEDPPTLEVAPASYTLVAPLPPLPLPPQPASASGSLLGSRQRQV